MNKIILILKREYLSRVKKKSFIVMTILGPVLIALFYGSIIWLATSKIKDSEYKRICVSDQSGLFRTQDTVDNLVMQSVGDSRDTILARLRRGGCEAALFIGDKDLMKADSVEIISTKSLSVTETSAIRSHMKDKVGQGKLRESGLRQGFLDSLKPKISLITAEIDESGKLRNASGEIKAVAGFVLCFLIYFFIFLYGVQVMRGVMEEKTNRIVEVIISSVKPFQLMMGKILGIALVGLTQFAVWVILSLIFSGVVSALSGGALQGAVMSAAGPMQNPQMSAVMAESSGVGPVLAAITEMNWFAILGLFGFYFIGGYLLYSSLFAAIGSAVDQETDTQQFMFPVTIPLVFSIIIAQMVVFQDPYGSIARWTSIFPLTSPIVMVVRAPFIDSIPLWEVLASMASLVLCFILFVKLAGRIYRIGILTYGKKPRWKDLARWIFTRA